MKRYIRANLNYVNSHLQEDSYQRVIDRYGFGAAYNPDRMLKLINSALEYFPNSSMNAYVHKAFSNRAGTNGIVAVFAGPMSELQQDVCKIIKDTIAYCDGAKIYPKIVGNTVTYHLRVAGYAAKRTVTLTFEQVTTKNAQKYKETYGMDVYIIRTGQR